LRPLADTLDDQMIWSVVDAAPDAIVLADEGGQILLVNRQTELLFGADRGELLGRPVEELLPERFRDVHRAHRTRYRAEPRPRAMGAGLQLFGKRTDGTEVPIEISLSPIQTAQGMRVVAAIRDITERVAAEARAREIREILDATADAVSIFDAQTLRFTYVNQGLVNQVGYRADELLDMTMLHIAPELTAPEVRRLLAALEHNDGAPTTFRTSHRRRDGHDVPVEILMQAITDGSGRPRSYVKIARDVTDRLESDARHRHAEHELRILEERERMARDLHDVVIQRLFAAGMTLQGVMALSDLDERNRRVRAVVDQIDDTIREIRTVIFGLQHIVDGHGLRGQIISLIEEHHSALGFAPQVHLDGPLDHLPEDVVPPLLALLREAITNVAKHAHATTATVSVVSGKDRVAFRVIDDGIGIGSAARTDGNGLRNLVRRAEALHGTVTIGPGEDGGTVVQGQLPFVGV
jgi:two-component system sensor histidine kinase DevS